MRRFAHDAAPDVLAEPLLPLAAWEALPPCARVAHRVADIVTLLGMIRDELHTEEGSGLLWVEERLDRVLAEADRVLRRLAV